MSGKYSHLYYRRGKSINSFAVHRLDGGRLFLRPSRHGRRRWTKEKKKRVDDGGRLLPLAVRKLNRQITSPTCKMACAATKIGDNTERSAKQRIALARSGTLARARWSDTDGSDCSMRSDTLLIRSVCPSRGIRSQRPHLTAAACVCMYVDVAVLISGRLPQSNQKHYAVISTTVVAWRRSVCTRSRLPLFPAI